LLCFLFENVKEIAFEGVEFTVSHRIYWIWIY